MSIFDFIYRQMVNFNYQISRHLLLFQITQFYEINDYIDRINLYLSRDTRVKPSIFHHYFVTRLRRS